MNSTLERLKERKLVQWAVAYLAGAWLVLQVLGELNDAYAWPAVVMRSVPVLLGFGLLVALVLAWYHGEKGQQRVSGPELLMVATLLVIAGGVVWAVGGQPTPLPSSTSAPEPPARGAGASRYAASVAVLPFSNLGGGAENEYFSDGITEEIISELAKVEGLKVISRTSVVALKGAKLTLPQIADTLGVRHVLEGSVRRAGDRVRVTAQLIDPQTDTHLWAETFDRQLTDIFQIQSEIAQRVSSALLTQVAGLRPRAPGSRTEETAAYDAYLRGTFARQRPTPDGLRTAMVAFEEAISIDSTYAPAYAGLAAVHVVWALYAYRGGLEPYAGISRALALAERAVALDSTLAYAYAMRAHARLRAWMPAEIVLRDLERAVQLAPSDGEIRLLRGVALAFAGRIDDAVQESEAAVVLNPLSPGGHDFRAVSLVLARRYKEALREARLAQVLEPRFLHPRRQEARALLLLGRYTECAALNLGPYLALRAMCRHSAGAITEARASIDSLSAAVNAGSANLPLHPGALAGDLAEYHAWIGDVDGTIQWLTRSAELSPINQFLVTETETYDRVRGEPRFQSQLKRIRGEIRVRVERANR
jgi:TolB-like protein